MIKENNMNIKINEIMVDFIEKKIGDIIDWRGAVEFALWEYANNNKKNRNE